MILCDSVSMREWENSSGVSRENASQFCFDGSPAAC